MNVSALYICLIARFGCTISNIIYKTLSDNRHYILPQFYSKFNGRKFHLLPIYRFKR